MFLRGLAGCLLAIGFATFIPRSHAIPQSDQSGSAESNPQAGKTENPTGGATSRPLPDHSHNPRDMGSAYVPLDSGIYPALSPCRVRLRGKEIRGYASVDSHGMRANDR